MNAYNLNGRKLESTGDLYNKQLYMVIYNYSSDMANYVLFDKNFQAIQREKIILSSVTWSINHDILTLINDKILKTKLFLLV